MAQETQDTQGKENGKQECKTLTRAELTRAVHQRIGLSASEINFLINDFLDRAAREIEQGNSVKLASFGTFLVKKRAQRPARNPKTNRPAIVPERRVVLFRPAAILRERVAAREEHGKKGEGNSI